MNKKTNPNKNAQIQTSPKSPVFMQIIRRKKAVVIFFAVSTLVCAILSLLVSVNYNMMDYLPKSAQSTTALAVLEAEFAQAVPNGRVMLTDVTLQEALDYKKKLSAVAGVIDVLWLDDIMDIKKPLEMADRKIVETYYKDGNALISITVADGQETRATQDIHQIIGDENAISGQVAASASMQSMASSETTRAFLILIPVIILILLAATSSWLEPVLFLLTIGVSVLINMGTNIFFGEISFMTSSISPILQLAVSLDYAIFLLRSFEKYRQQTDDVGKAMAMAMKRAFPAIAASAATTLFGFLALAFMKFRIGSDLGLNLAKGIILSFISVMVFLPALTLLCYKWIDKTKHKKLMPEFKNIGKGVLKIRYLCIALVLIAIVPSFLAQRSNSYTYGMESNLTESDRTGRDNAKINEVFGESNAIVLLVAKGDLAKEELLCSFLAQIDHVTSVIAYANMVGTAIPAEFVDESVTDQFYSENYARIILYTNTAAEGDIAFAVVKAVQAAAESYYGEGVLACGQSVNLYDMKNVVESDSTAVNLIAVLAIAAVLLLTFKSVSLPLVLLLTIETSIWINLAIPYLTSSPLCYIGFLVISTVQLGATVDYAILLTDHDMEFRKHLPAREAVEAALGAAASSIFISGSILSAAGFSLGFVSSNQIVSEMGILIGRGTLLSVLMVTLFLPALLLLLDRMIPLTTLRTSFFKGDKPDEKIQ